MPGAITSPDLKLVACDNVSQFGSLPGVTVIVFCHDLKRGCFRWNLKLDPIDR